MKNTGELIAPALEPYKFFNQEFCSFNQLVKIGENVAEKNRELFTENLSLRSEIERLKKINFIDGMTGIYNKRYLKIRLGEEFAKARRYGSPISSIFIDLDDFKAINDTYGHIIGDKLLKEAASVLEDLCRSEDVLIRFGGDEFVVLMSDTCASEALILAERIRKKVADHIFSYGDIKISVSASLGASTLNNSDFEHVSDPEKLISMADRAMYRVKQKGKNNTCHLPFSLTPSGAMGKNLPGLENLLACSHTCPGFCPPTQIIYKILYFIFNWSNLRNMRIKNTEELK